MAMKVAEADTTMSSKKRKSDTPETQNLMSKNNKTLSSNLIKLIGSFLIDFELKHYCETDSATYNACKNDMIERKIVKEKILPLIFSATPDAFDAFLEEYLKKHPNITMKILLTKARFSEGYESRYLKKFICFREWGAVSPLTAAFYSGDYFLGVRILVHILQHDIYREEVIRQLTEVLRRIRTDQTLILQAIDAIISEDTTTLDSIQHSETFQDQINDQTIMEEAIASGFKPIQNIKNSEPSLHENALDQNTLAEKKENEDNLKIKYPRIKYAEDAEFLTPVLRLLKASLHFLIKYPELARKGNFNELDNLWGIVSECHKRLFHNIKQEYFDPNKTFSTNPLPDFNHEPYRGLCCYENNAFLDLDDLGIGTMSAFYKVDSALWLTGYIRGFLSLHLYRFRENLGAITPYYKLRITGLENIVEQLKTANTSAAFVEKITKNLNTKRN